MKAYPKITIVTPVFNRVNMLEQTMLSVLGQNYPNLEYIIIDGGSTDGTVDVIRQYEDKLAYWVSEPDSGMYHAIQKGFEKATGDIMAWINSDDLYHAYALWTVADIFLDLPDVEWIVGTPTMYNSVGRCAKVFPTIRWSKRKFELGDYRWIQQESVFWKRTLWEKAGSQLNLSYKLAADFELWCRFFQYSKLYSVNTILGGFRLHGEQLSIEQKNKYEIEALEVLAKHFVPRFRICQFAVTSFWRKILKQEQIDKYLYKCPSVVFFDFDLQQWKK